MKYIPSLIHCSQFDALQIWNKKDRLMSNHTVENNYAKHRRTETLLHWDISAARNKANFFDRRLPFQHIIIVCNDAFWRSMSSHKTAKSSNRTLRLMLSGSRSMQQGAAAGVAHWTLGMAVIEKGHVLPCPWVVCCGGQRVQAPIAESTLTWWDCTYWGGKERKKPCPSRVPTWAWDRVDACCPERPGHAIEVGLVLGPHRSGCLPRCRGGSWARQDKARSSLPWACCIGQVVTVRAEAGLSRNTGCTKRRGPLRLKSTDVIAISWTCCEPEVRGCWWYDRYKILLFDIRLSLFLQEKTDVHRSTCHQHWQLPGERGPAAVLSLAVIRLGNKTFFNPGVGISPSETIT